jgi:hypothetical protein
MSERGRIEGQWAESNERRGRRSSVRAEALGLLLAAERERSGAHALVVASMEGLPLPGVGAVAPETAAAAAASRLAGMASHPVVGELSSRAFAVSVVHLDDGRSVLVTSIDGGRVSGALESGVRRILRSDRGAPAH